MQFLGQLRSARPASEESDLLLLFMCQNDPGLCEDWDANAGGNAVVAVLADDLQPAEAPSEGAVLRDTCYGAAVLPFAADDYEAARTGWAEANGRSTREVLGQIGGESAWVQQDETPNCDLCGQPMTLAAQLEQGPDAKTEMNFGGGGCAYVFRCRCDAGSAKMLWQC